MRVYIAGPMRGYADYNFPAFRAAAERLRSMGHDVFDPSEAENPTDPLKPLWQYMQKDLPIVCGVDMLVLLPGWEHSEGVAIEHVVARMLGKTVVEYTNIIKEGGPHD
jgi:hypothetical protein